MAFKSATVEPKMENTEFVQMWETIGDERTHPFTHC